MRQKTIFSSLVKHDFISDIRNIDLKKLMGKLTDFDYKWNIRCIELAYRQALASDKDFILYIDKRLNPTSDASCLKSSLDDYYAQSSRQATIGSLAQDLYESREEQNKQSQIASFSS
jgi:hypothetical protein